MMHQWLRSIKPSLWMIAIRVLAWCFLAAIIFATIVPPILRPVTGVPHTFEHVIIFLLAGTAFGLGYRGQEFFLYVSAISISGTLEISQLLVQGRHARLSDFAVDAFSACAGVFAASILVANSAHWITRWIRYECE
jgi:hypothetical protein